MLIAGAWWSLERGAGVAALALLTLATVLVVAGAGRDREALGRSSLCSRPRPPPCT